MKRLLFTLLVFGIALSAKPQSVLPQTAECVTCLNNEIHTRRFASAIGTNNVSIGERSFAGGINSQATGNYSFAFGEDVKATQRSSFAFGYLSEANGAFSAAIGRMAITSSSALHAMAFGYSVEANASASFVAGRFLRAAASNTIVLGGGYGTNDPLINNIPRSLMVGFNSNVPTLFVGESSGVGTTGNIGIGNVTNPAAKLHIKADNNKDATLRLEPTGSVNVARIEFGNEDYSLTSAPGSHFHFKVPEGKNFNFQNGKIITSSIQINQGAASGRVLKSDATGNTHWADSDWTPTLNNNLVRYTGNVGIGFIVEPAASLHVAGGDIYIEDITHGIIMKSPNGQCWRGTLTDQGNLQFSAVACPGLTTGSKPEIDAPKKIRMYPNPASTQLHIESEQELRNALVLISSLDGRSIKSQQVTGNAAMLDISGLALGAYIVNILENEVQIATQQLIVQ